MERRGHSVTDPDRGAHLVRTKRRWLRGLVFASAGSALLTFALGPSVAGWLSPVDPGTDDLGAGIMVVMVIAAALLAVAAVIWLLDKSSGGISKG